MLLMALCIHVCILFVQCIKKNTNRVFKKMCVLTIREVIYGCHLKEKVPINISLKTCLSAIYSLFV